MFVVDTHYLLTAFFVVVLLLPLARYEIGYATLAGRGWNWLQTYVNRCKTVTPV